MYLRFNKATWVKEPDSNNLTSKVKLGDKSLMFLPSYVTIPKGTTVVVYNEAMATGLMESKTASEVRAKVVGLLLPNADIFDQYNSKKNVLRYQIVKSAGSSSTVGGGIQLDDGDATGVSAITNTYVSVNDVKNPEWGG